MNRATFDRAQKLLGPGDFARVFEGNHRVRGRNLVFLVKEVSEGPAKLGFALSRKTIRHAVRRNMVKRQVRELFRKQSGDVAKIHLVVLAARGAPKIENKQQIQEEVALLWSKLKKRWPGC